MESLHALIKLVLRLVYFLGLDFLIASKSDAELAKEAIESQCVSGGLVGVVNRVTLDVIVKRPHSETLGGRMACKQTKSWREAKFLQEQVVSSYYTPRVYSSWYNEYLGDFYIVMQRVKCDVLKSHIGNQNHTNGNLDPPQLEFPGTKGPEEFLRMAFEKIGEFHAERWNDETLLKQDWLKGTNWYFAHGEEPYRVRIRNAKRLMSSGLKTRSDLVSNTLVKEIQNALDCADFHAMVRYCQVNDYSICHGDFHGGNVLIDAEMALYFIDFSEVGVFDPVFDLSQLLISDLYGIHYDKMLKPLLTAWYDTVQRVTRASQDLEIDFDKLYVRFLIGGLRRWYYLLAVLIGVPAVPDAAIEYFGENLSFWSRFVEKEIPDPGDRVIDFVKV